MLIESREAMVTPEYFQFYLKTPSSEWTSAQVTGQGYEAHIEATSPGFSYVGTNTQFSHTAVSVELHNSEPDSLPPQWQHVAEVSFQGEGTLQIMSWSGELGVAVDTPVGPLRLRAAWAGLQPEVVEDRGKTRANREHLLFQIWPAVRAERRVLRWWSGWELPPSATTAPDGRRQVEGVDEVVEMLRSLRRAPVDFTGHYGKHPPLPGGDSGQCVGIWGDPRDGTWWVDGYDQRRVLRVATADEVRGLVPQTEPTVFKDMHRPAPDPRWSEMLKSVGLTPG
jgi:hypothetical protein